MNSSKDSSNGDAGVSSGGSSTFPRSSARLLVDERGNVDDPPELTPASPFDESFDEFMLRARTHYHAVQDWHERRGFSQRPVKREMDHFRYLAAHLVVDHSWATIAK